MENNKPFPSKDSIIYDSANDEIIVKVADTTSTLINRMYWGQWYKQGDAFHGIAYFFLQFRFLKENTDFNILTL